MIVYVGSKNLYRSSNIVNQLYNEYNGFIPFRLDPNKIELHKQFVYCLTINDLVVYDLRTPNGIFKYINVIQGAINSSDKINYGLIAKSPQINIRNEIDMNRFVNNILLGHVKENEISKSLFLELKYLYDNNQGFWDIENWKSFYYSVLCKNVSDKQLLRYRELYLKRIGEVLQRVDKENLFLYFAPLSEARLEDGHGYICTTNPNYVKFVDVEKRR